MNLALANLKRKRTSILTVMSFSLLLTLVVSQRPALGHFHEDVPAECGNVHSADVLAGRSADVLPVNDTFYVKSRSEVTWEHCYHDHYHYVVWFDGYEWKTGGERLCGVWRYGDWYWNPEREYNCIIGWSVTPYYYWSADAGFATRSNHFAGLAGNGGHTDGDYVQAPQCYIDLYTQGQHGWIAGCPEGGGGGGGGGGGHDLPFRI